MPYLYFFNSYLFTSSFPNFNSDDKSGFLFPNLKLNDKQSPTKTNITATIAADLNPVATAICCGIELFEAFSCKMLT